MSQARKEGARRSRTSLNRKSSFSRRTGNRDGRRRHLRFEPLEQRCLLSVAPFYTAQTAQSPLDLTLRLDSQGEVPMLELLDTAGGGQIHSMPLSQITDTVVIEGSRFDDSLTIDLDTSSLQEILPAGIRFEGDQGDDTLRGPDVNTLWSIIGEDAGHVGPDGAFAFTGVEYLVGGTDNEDTFVLLPGGSLSGSLHGGPAGYDTLSIEGGSYTNVTYQATGPDSGVIQLDDNVIRYAGLEPIGDNSDAVNRVLTAPAGHGDTITILDGPSDNIRVEADLATFETHNYAQPSRSLTIDAGDLDDTIVYELEDLFSNIETSIIIIDGGAGTDTVDVSGRIFGMTVLKYSDGSAALTDDLGNYVLVRNVENFIGQDGTIYETGIPAWLEQGPGTIQNGQVQGITDLPVAGAVQAIAQHPFQDDVLFIGTAAGGVWRTIDRGVTWTPMTDQFPSLAIGDVAISNFDADGAALSVSTPLNKLVVYAGTGKFSNSGDGGSNIGVYKSVNGGARWALVGANDMAGLPLTAVAPVSANTVLAAALDKQVITRRANGSARWNRDGTIVTDVRREGGVLRSTDGGADWSNLSELGLSGLPDGPVSDLVADPGNADTFYAGVVGQGVYRTIDGGAIWTNATGNLPGVADTLRIVLSVSGTADSGTSNRPIYAAILHNRATLAAQSNSGTNTLTVDRPDIFSVGQRLRIANVDVSGGGGFASADWETVTVQTKAGNVLTLTGNLTNTHASGRIVRGSRDQVTGVYRSADHGTTWTKMAFLGDAEGGVNPGGQAMKNFALAASPTDANVVYASGDRQTKRVDGKTPSVANPNASGATGWVARIFQGTFAPGGGSWTPVVGTNASGTAPHADSRELIFDKQGNLLDGNDGGIYRLQNTGSGGQTWQSMIGTLRTTEVRSLSYDPINNVISVGNQDVGSAIQPTGLPDPLDGNGDGVPDDADTRFVWQQTPVSYSGGGSARTLMGDGNTQAVIVAAPDRVIRFTMGNTWKNFVRHEFDETGADITPMPTLVDGVWTNSTGGPMRKPNDADGNFFKAFDQQVGLRSSSAARVLSGLTATDQGAGFTTIPMVVNAIDNTYMMIGLNSLYESSNQLEVISEVQPKPGSAKLSAIAYGGMNRMSGNPNLDFADANPDTITRAAGSWQDEGFRAGHEITIGGAGANNGTYTIDTVTATVLTLTAPASLTAAAAVADVTVTAPNRGVTMVARYNRVFVRTNDVMDNTFTPHTIAGAGKITAVIFDPDDWRTAYAVDSASVFRTTDGGANWAVISTKLVTSNLQTLEIVRAESGTKVLLVGSEQGVFRTLDPVPDAVWTEFGRGLPNALARDLEFVDRTGSDDVLLAGLLGRGVFTIAGDAGAMLDDESVLQIDGTSANDVLRVVRSEANASLLDVYVNSIAPVFSVPISSVQRIEINGLGGTDTLVVDSTQGAIYVPEGIVIDGGDDSDTLRLDGDRYTDRTVETDGPNTTITIRDFLSGQTQKVIYSNIETLDDNLTEADPLNILGDGIDEFLVWLNRMSSEGAEDELAVIGNSLPRALTGAPVSTTLPGAIPDPEAPSGGGLAQEGTPGFQRLFESGFGGFSLDDIGSLIATPEALEASLEGLDEIADNVSYSMVGGFPVFDVQIEKRLEGTADFQTGFEFLGGSVDLTGLMEIGALVVLDFEFGVDAQGFFVDVSGGNELVVRDITLEGAAGASGDFGFFEVEVGVEEFTVAEDVQFAVNLTKATDGGKLRFSDLDGPMASFLDVTITGDAGEDDVVLRASATVSGIDLGSGGIDFGGAEVTLTWADINDPTTVGVAASAGLAQDLIDFLRVGPQQILDQLGTLREFSVAFNGQEVPLVGDTLDAIVDVIQMVDTKILQPITNTVSGSSNFGTLQDLLRRLSRELGIDPDELGLAYDSPSKELTWTLNLEETFSVTDALDLGFDLENGLADVSFSTDASIEAALGLELIVGIDLGDLIATPGDPGRWLFLRDPTASASLTLTAADLDASARFGFLSIGIVDGSATANPTFSLSLDDPGTHAADGRIDLGELLDALGSPNLEFTGSADIDLPISVPFLGISPGPDTTLGIDWSDLSDPATISVDLPADLFDMDKFTNMDAGTLVGLLAQVTGWLSDFGGSDAFSIDVPLVGDVLDGVMALGDMVHKTLMYDDMGTDDTGDDVAKLVDEANQPTFSTAQEFAEKLNIILGVPDLVVYDEPSESLLIELLLSDTFGTVDLPLDFNLDFGPLGDLTSEGSLEMTADGELGITLGIYLGNEGAVELTTGMLLSSLKNGDITFNKDLVVAATDDVSILYGQLSDDAVFSLIVD
ncbi:MAG: hypothetical protein V3R99_13165, partial [Thermoguttaceae bacterium]